MAADMVALTFNAGASDGLLSSDNISAEEAAWNRLNDEEHAEWAATRAAAKQPTIEDYQQETLRRAVAATCWHLNRQELRGIPGNALDALLTALWEPALVSGTADDAAIDAALEAAHSALLDAKLEAENNATPAAGRDQSIKMDGGEVHALLMSWEWLEIVRRDLRDGLCTALEAAWRVVSIAFDTPSEQAQGRRKCASNFPSSHARFTNPR